MFSCLTCCFKNRSSDEDGRNTQAKESLGHPVLASTSGPTSEICLQDEHKNRSDEDGINAQAKESPGHIAYGCIAKPTSECCFQDEHFSHLKDFDFDYGREPEEVIKTHY